MNSIVRTASIVTIVVLMLLVSSIFVSCDKVNQNQLGFEYDVTSGKPVSPENNPLLPFGWHSAWGVNKKLFIINAEVNTYSFTATNDKFSPFNEAMSWDSSEGATMSGTYTIQGRVTDPWKFYSFFGTPQRSFSKVEGIQDEKIYAALRLAGRYAGIRMAELGQKAAAESIMRNPKQYADKLTADCADYASKFGFTVTKIQFPKAFEFPGGNAITKGREMLQAANADYETKKITAKNADEAKKDQVAKAKVTADVLMGEGDRRADELLSEAKALAEQLSTSIKQVGVDGTMQLKMAELQGDLMAAGVMPQAILTGDSIFGKPFYGKAGKSPASK